MPSKKRTQQETLIESLYDLTLDPNNFGTFTQAWEEYLVEHQLNDKDANISDYLVGHFGRAFEIMQTFGRENSLQTGSAKQFVLAKETPSIALRACGKIVYINEKANQLLRQHGETSLIQNLIHEKSRPSLERALKRTQESDLQVPTMVLLPNSQPALMVMQRRINSEEIVVDISGSTWDKNVEQTLKSMYSVSDKECDIAANFFHGLTVNDIAEREHRNIETVRKQTKSLLKKTQTHSQPKLMRLLTSLNFAKVPSSEPRWSHSQADNFNLLTGDGRNIAYYDTGPRNQKVIVVIHGILHDPELPTTMHQRLLELGYRIIGVSRAWYGDSSPPLNKTALLSGSATDLVSVLDHLDIEKVSLLGIMAGAIHGYATAANYPERVERVIGIAGIVPFFSDSQIETMPKSVRALIYTAKYFPKLLPLLIRTAVAMIDRGDMKNLLESTYNDSPVDSEATRQPDIYTRMVRGSQFASFYGHTAYTYEAIATAQNISELIEKIRCPVNLIHGEKDRMTVIKSVKKYCQEYDGFSFEIIEQAGHLLIYSHANAATRCLEKILGECSAN